MNSEELNAGIEKELEDKKWFGRSLGFTPFDGA